MLILLQIMCPWQESECYCWTFKSKKKCKGFWFAGTHNIVYLSNCSLN